MSPKTLNYSELFITRMRWLVIFGSPILFYLSDLKMGIFFWGVVLGTAVMNLVVHFYLLTRSLDRIYSHLLSFADIFYVSTIFFLEGNNQSDLDQLYFFAILVLGIRYGVKRYFGLVSLIGLVYMLVFVSKAWFYQIPLNSVILISQIIYFGAFGILTSFILQREHDQQQEKEKLINELQAAYRQLSIYNAKVEEMAIKDSLTNLYNYRYFKERMAQEMDWAKKYYKPLSLILIDIDRFKNFNDTFGHPAGDKALKTTAKVFLKNVRDVDILARYGGEEFLVLLPDTKVEEALFCAERIRKAVEKTEIEIKETDQPVKITVSIGVSSFPDKAQTADELIKKADEALYTAKNTGRNRVHVYN